MAEPSPASAITYTPSEADLIAYHDLASRRRARATPRLRSWTSALFVPLALGAGLAGVALLPGGAGPGGVGPMSLGPMLVVATVAYLAGVFAVQYEASRHTRIAVPAIFRANPLWQNPKQVSLRDDALADTSLSVSVQYRYAAFTEVEVTRDLVLAWLGSAAAALVPVRAFANMAEAEAFARELRRRIAAARGGA